MIVFDEYFNYPGWHRHERWAFEEFLNEGGLDVNYLGYVPSHQQLCVTLRSKTKTT